MTKIQKKNMNEYDEAEMKMWACVCRCKLDGEKRIFSGGNINFFSLFVDQIQNDGKWFWSKCILISVAFAHLTVCIQPQYTWIDGWMDDQTNERTSTKYILCWVWVLVLSSFNVAVAAAVQKKQFPLFTFHLNTSHLFHFVRAAFHSCENHHFWNDVMVNVIL